MTGTGSDSRRRVLLVDDSILVLRIASAYLKDHYEVITGTSGEEALSQAASERPDVILMDLHMPGRSGSEIAHRLSQDPRTSHIPVVIMTTESESPGLPSHLDHLVKPFDRATLLAKLAARLPDPPATNS